MVVVDAETGMDPGGGQDEDRRGGTKDGDINGGVYPAHGERDRLLPRESPDDASRSLRCCAFCFLSMSRFSTSDPGVYLYPG